MTLSEKLRVMEALWEDSTPDQMPSNLPLGTRQS